MSSKPKEDTVMYSIDVETTMNGDADTGTANPMHQDNKVVYYGVARSSPDYTQVYHEASTKEFIEYLEKEVAYNERIKRTTTFCGCNFSFDLLYMYKQPRLKKLIESDSVRIWDIQLAEYLITGQQSKFASLDEMSIKYMLPTKDDAVTEYFERGLGADFVPAALIKEYLTQDVNNTISIANLQRLEVIRLNMLPLVLSQMVALQATTDMTYNGLRISQAAMEMLHLSTLTKYAESKTFLEATAAVDDIDSPKKWSQYFFGGKKKVKVKTLVGLYKNGNNKYAMVDAIATILPAVSGYTPDPDKVSKATGIVSVDDSVLNELLALPVPVRVKSIVKGLLTHRELSKQLGTYINGLSKHIMGSGYIHGKLNHTLTSTGRLSSSSPNLQNISNNPIKSTFISRYEDGLLVEIDFSQLEVAVLAHKSMDIQLISDIASGVDIHSALYCGMFGRMPTKEERKPFKARTFQLLYGAGANAIAKQSGCSVDEAKKFIEVFYTRYPGVGTWQRHMMERVATCAVRVADKKTGGIDIRRQATVSTETGRRFVFWEYENTQSWAKEKFSFSPTEVKNYPVQGLATGDIVPLMLGVVWKTLKGRDDVKMINTVHDSLVFDVRIDAIGEFILSMEEVISNTHMYFEDTFDTPLALKLKAGVSYGVNWYEQKELTK